ncbi:MAG: sulfotransferase domain-containing protein [Chlamydiales bacterium]
MKIRALTLFFCLFFLSHFQASFSDEWTRIYLATYPRSGNHWVRYLIEEAAHIATGSVYPDRDPPHLPDPFPWGGFSCDHGYKGNCRYPDIDDFVLIKTHFPGQKNKITEFDNLPYHLTIRIVRNPIDSFYSQYVKRSGGHPKNEKIPSKMVEESIQLWQRFQQYWNKQKNVITIRYEDMLDNPTQELTKILQALQYKVTEEDIARAIAKYPPEGDIFKHIEHFYQKDLRTISIKLNDLLNQFDYATPLKNKISEKS